MNSYFICQRRIAPSLGLATIGQDDDDGQDQQDNLVDPGDLCNPVWKVNVGSDPGLTLLFACKKESCGFIFT
jgi:hypothetical protein